MRVQWWKMLAWNSIILLFLPFIVLAAILPGRRHDKLIWGVEPMQYKAGIERPIILFGQLRLQERHIWMIAITAVLVLALHLMNTFQPRVSPPIRRHAV